MNNHKEEELRLIAEDIMAGKPLTEETVRNLCGKYYNPYFGSYVCRRAISTQPYPNEDSTRTYFAYFLIMDKDFYMLTYKVGDDGEEDEYPAQVAVRVYPHHFGRTFTDTAYVKAELLYPSAEKKAPLTTNELIEYACSMRELPAEEVMRLALHPHERERFDFKWYGRGDEPMIFQQHIDERGLMRAWKQQCQAIWKVNNNSYYSITWEYNETNNSYQFCSQPMVEMELHEEDKIIKYREFRKKG